VTPCRRATGFGHFEGSSASSRKRGSAATAVGYSNVCHLQTECTQLNAVNTASYSAFRPFPFVVHENRQQSFPVGTIPPVLHTHSFNYHPRYIMFLSQHFSFPPSVPFHQCSIPIHSPTTHAIECFSPSASVFPCQYHSTNAPYPFIHLPPTLYNVSLPVLQFSSVSTIPPLLHTHSFNHDPRYIMFLSRYFSFPLSVPFHQCSKTIHSPTTHII